MTRRIKVWHDDIRRPPDDTWDAWVRTNDEAKLLLASGRVREISLDHDLGMHDQDPDDLEAVFFKGGSSDDGYALVVWMIEHGHVPETVTIHSWNPPGAEAMAARLRRHGYTCVIKPFTVPPRDGLQSGSG